MTTSITTPSRIEKTSNYTKAFIMLTLALVLLILYTFLHEFGHALPGLIFGGTIHSFNINFLNLSANASIDGDFSRGQQLMINLGGPLLPFLVWVGFMMVVPRKANPGVELIKFGASIGVVNTLLPWIIFHSFTWLEQLLMTTPKHSFSFPESTLRWQRLEPRLSTLSGGGCFLER